MAITLIRLYQCSLDFIFKGKTESPAISGRFDCGSRCHHLGVPIRLHSLCCASARIQLWLYGLSKKRTSLPSAIGLTLETFMIMPIALGICCSATCSASGCRKRRTWLLLFLAGVFTALPLLLFAEGAKRLPLYQVGILQYIAPTITLLIGLFVYHEPFSSSKAFTFSCIWAALLLFTFSQVKWKRRQKAIEAFGFSADAYIMYNHFMYVRHKGARRWTMIKR